MSNTPRSDMAASDEAINELRARAESRGDKQLARICELAMRNDWNAFSYRCACADAIREGK